VAGRKARYATASSWIAAVRRFCGTRVAAVPREASACRSDDPAKGFSEEKKHVNEDKTIAVAAEDQLGLGGQVAAHFGRCPAYVVVRATGNRIRDVRVVGNPYHHEHRPGQVPRFLRELGTDTILTGGIGHRAAGILSESGVDVTTGLSGRVCDALSAYFRGKVEGGVQCAHDGRHDCVRGRHEEES
jgi:predicted Fe-Mo cluster-binding NifX family protein